MNKTQKWAIGGLLAVAFGTAAFWPVERHVEGKVVAAQLRHTSPDVCILEQVRLAPSHDDSAPERIADRVTLDTRELGLQTHCGFPIEGKAEVKTNRAEILWDRLNGHHGLRAARFEFTR